VATFIYRARGIADGGTLLPRAYDPETVSALRAALDEAWDSLTPEQQARSLKTDMALRILELAEAGVRDIVSLRAAAMIGVLRDKRPAAPSVPRGVHNRRATKEND
jgi:hypothetical protein